MSVFLRLKRHGLFWWRCGSRPPDPPVARPRLPSMYASLVRGSVCVCFFLASKPAVGWKTRQRCVYPLHGPKKKGRIYYLETHGQRSNNYFSASRTPKTGDRGNYRRHTLPAFGTWVLPSVVGRHMLRSHFLTPLFYRLMCRLTSRPINRHHACQARMIPPLSGRPQEDDVDKIADISGPQIDDYAVGSDGGGGGGPDVEPRSPATAYVSMFHRRKHRRSKTDVRQEPQHQKQPSFNSNPNTAGPRTTATPSGRTHHRNGHGHGRGRGGGGRSVTGSFLDGSDVSIRGLLETTFAPTVHGAGAHAFAPIPMNALAETLREARDNRTSNSPGLSGTHIFPARNPFSTTLPSSLGLGGGGGGKYGGGGKHSRVKSTSNVEPRAGGGGGRFTHTLGAMAAPWNRRGSAVEPSNNAAGINRRPNHGKHEAGTGGDGGGDGDDEEDDDWDPFTLGAAVESAVATATDVVPGDHAPPRHAIVHRTKSRQLLRAGELAGRDPREAAKLMTKEPFFVEIDKDGGAKHQQNQRRHSHRGLLGRRNSERGAAAPPQPPLSTLLSPKTTAAGGSGGASRRHSSVSEKSSGGGGNNNASLSVTSGGFAFSCDAKAQRAEIAMILGRRASPMPRTASFVSRHKSAAARAAAAAAAGGGGPAALRAVAEGEDVIGEAEVRGIAGVGDRGVADRTVPPLQRRSSGLGAGLTRRFSQRSPFAPADVQEEGEEEQDGKEGDKGEEDEKEEGEGERRP